MKKVIDFNAYGKNNNSCGNNARAIISNGKVESVKPLGKVPRQFYYSFIQDMLDTFDKEYPQYRK